MRWIDVLTGFILCLKSTSVEIDVFLDQVVQEHMIMKGDDGLPNKNEFVDNLLDLSSLIKISKHSYWSLSLSLSLSLSIYIYNMRHTCSHTI